MSFRSSSAALGEYGDCLSRWTKRSTPAVDCFGTKCAREGWGCARGIRRYTAGGVLGGSTLQAFANANPDSGVVGRVVKSVVRRTRDRGGCRGVSEHRRFRSRIRRAAPPARQTDGPSGSAAIATDRTRLRVQPIKAVRQPINRGRYHPSGTPWCEQVAIHNIRLPHREPVERVERR